MATQPFNYLGAIQAGYNLWNSDKNSDATKETAADSSAFWNSVINRTESDQDAVAGFMSNLAGALSTGLLGGGDVKRVGGKEILTPDLTASAIKGLPSFSTPYASVNAANDTVTPFANNVEVDRANMLAALLNAADASSRRVDIQDYNTDQVKQIADRKFSGSVGGIDRAAAIASSQGFSKALNGGMADSTAAATQANALSREFADLYAKLRSESDSLALAENEANYKNYLSGQQAEVDQNSKIAAALNNLYATTATKASNAESIYNKALDTKAARDLEALKLDDTALLEYQKNQNAANQTLNQSYELQNKAREIENNYDKFLSSELSTDNSQLATLLSNLYKIYSGNQHNLTNAAHSKYTIDSTNAGDAATGEGGALASFIDQLAGNPVIGSIIGKAGDTAVNAINSMIGKGVNTVSGVIQGLFDQGIATQEEIANFADVGMNADWGQLLADAANAELPQGYEDDLSWLNFGEFDLPTNYDQDESWLNFSN